MINLIWASVYFASPYRGQRGDAQGRLEKRLEKLTEATGDLARMVAELQVKSNGDIKKTKRVISRELLPNSFLNHFEIARFFQA